MQPEGVVPLDSRITAPVTIPNEAWGHYTFGRDLDLLEVDLEPRGVTGYITLMSDKHDKTADKAVPLTFSFTKTRVGGDSIYFQTQQIHRTSYEFRGSLEQSPPKDKTLDVDYSLVGTLTLHDQGKTTSRQVAFKKMAVRFH